MKKLLPCLIGILLATAIVQAQRSKPKPTPPPNQKELIMNIVSSGESVENGIFKSAGGKFSIAIPELPTQTLDNATEKAKAKGVDVGKQFVWLFGRTFYTLFYTNKFDHDGNLSPTTYSDIETGTRKGILNAGATLLSEKLIKLSTYRGTEFRYLNANGVRYINRVYLVGEMGYQVMGGYADEKDEPKILAVLNSFTPKSK